jgi:uncharacterized Zn-finger protein
MAHPDNLIVVPSSVTFLFSCFVFISSDSPLDLSRPLFTAAALIKDFATTRTSPPTPSFELNLLSPSDHSSIAGGIASVASSFDSGISSSSEDNLGGLIIVGGNERPSSTDTVTSSSFKNDTNNNRSRSANAPATTTAAPKGRTKKMLPCDYCGKCFDRPSLLNRHLRTHTGERPHVCDVCSKGFSTSSSLNTHRRIHSGEKPHECGVCGKRFTASSNLYYHRMTHVKVSSQIVFLLWLWQSWSDKALLG